MALELVTGKGPSNHITSAQIGALNAGIFGTGRYILKTSDRLPLSVSGNTATIGAGDAIIDGRHVTNETAEAFTIPNGTQGSLRYDLIVIRYEDNGGIESASLAYLQGEPSATSPTDPSYNNGSILDGDSSVDVPLYRITVSGVTVTATKKLLSEAGNVKQMTEAANVPKSVSVTLSHDDYSYMDVWSVAGQVYMTINAHFDTWSGTGNQLLFTMPQGYRVTELPAGYWLTIPAVAVDANRNYKGNCYATFDPSGGVYIQRSSTTTWEDVTACFSCAYGVA